MEFIRVLFRSTARVVLSWPVHNFGLSLPNLLATVAGNLSELKAFSGLRLLDLKLPPVFLDRFQGPQFGVAGTRTLAGVYGRPLIGTIIKPSVGLDPEATAAQVAGLFDEGIAFIQRSEERRLGKEGVKTCRDRCWAEHSKKK